MIVVFGDPLGGGGWGVSVLVIEYLSNKHPSSSDHEEDAATNSVHQSNGNEGGQDIDNINDAAHRLSCQLTHMPCAFQ